MRQHWFLAGVLAFVIGCGGGGGGGGGTPTPTLTPTTPPAAPTNVDAVKQSSTVIKVTWTDASTNETGFRVEFAIGSSTTYNTAATVGANVAEFTHTGLTPGTTYSYLVYAVNSAGTTEATNRDSDTTDAPQTNPPAAPATLTATAASSSAISLSWANVANEDLYKIERKTGASGTYSQIATTVANTTTYSDAGLTASTQYFYKVRAYNAAGDSSYSPEANATTQTGGGGGGGATWSTPTKISGTYSVSPNSTSYTPWTPFTLDVNGNPLLTWGDSANNWVSVTYTAGQWNAPALIPSPPQGTNRGAIGGGMAKFHVALEEKNSGSIYVTTYQ